MRVAIFDIDGTLISGASSERRFYGHLLRTGNQGPRQVLAAAWFLCRWWPRDGRHVFKKNKAYLAWLRRDKVRRLAAEWIAGLDGDLWFIACVDRLRRHRDAGDRIVLLSGTPDFIASAIADQLGGAEVIASECATRGDRFSAGRPGQHPFDQEKRRLAARFCRNNGIAPQAVIAYGDSIHDLPLLEWAGSAVAVRPDAQLESVALRRGWEIIGSHSQRPDRRTPLTSG